MLYSVLFCLLLPLSLFFRYGTLVAEYKNPNVPIAQSQLVPQYVIDDVYRDQAAFFTQSAAVVGIFYFLYHIFSYVFTIKNAFYYSKKGWLIFLIVVLVLMCAWDVMMFFSPHHISFDEVYVAWVAVSMILLLFDFILYQDMKKERRKYDDPDILDSGIGG